MVARRHDTIGVQLIDARDGVLPDAGLIAVRDPESGAWRYVDSSRPEIREPLRRLTAERDEHLSRTLRRHGVDLIRLRTGESYVVPLLAFFRMRERMRRH
jgi:uncharacterized protein (DUF58 family)